jgi:hypothetical protein
VIIRKKTKKRVQEHLAVNLLVGLYGVAQASKPRTGLRSTSPSISSSSCIELRGKGRGRDLLG